MAEDIVLGPTREIEPGPRGEEIEASLRQLGALFTRQSLDQNHMHFMEIAHIGGGIILLRLGQGRRAPVARLLLLGNFLAEQLLDQILESVPVGIGAHQLAGDLGAKHRRGDDAEIVLDRRKIEAGEMIELEPCRIGQNRLEIGRGKRAARGEADEMLVALPVGNLDQAQPVARGDQTHGLGIDRNRAGGEHASGEIVIVEVDSHMG